jgi:hypothetical protein
LQSTSQCLLFQNTLYQRSTTQAIRRPPSLTPACIVSISFDTPCRPVLRTRSRLPRDSAAYFSALCALPRPLPACLPPSLSPGPLSCPRCVSWACSRHGTAAAAWASVCARLSLSLPPTTTTVSLARHRPFATSHHPDPQIPGASSLLDPNQSSRVTRSVCLSSRPLHRPGWCTTVAALRIK